MYTPTQLQAIATLAARRAGEHVLANLHRRGDVNSILRTDIKHKLDVEAQEVATSVILSAFPDHAILGEETCDAPLPESDTVWIIDPIDGTINFFHGLPLWCCSVAVQYKEKTIAGAVFIPEMHQLYEATRQSRCVTVRRSMYRIRTSSIWRCWQPARTSGISAHTPKIHRRVSEIASVRVFSVLLPWTCAWWRRGCGYFGQAFILGRSRRQSDCRAGRWTLRGTQTLTGIAWHILPAALYDACRDACFRCSSVPVDVHHPQIVNSP